MGRGSGRQAAHTRPPTRPIRTARYGAPERGLSGAGFRRGLSALCARAWGTRTQVAQILTASHTAVLTRGVYRCPYRGPYSDPYRGRYSDRYGGATGTRSTAAVLGRFQGDAANTEKGSWRGSDPRIVVSDTTIRGSGGGMSYPTRRFGGGMSCRIRRADLHKRNEGARLFTALMRAMRGAGTPRPDYGRGVPRPRESPGPRKTAPGGSWSGFKRVAGAGVPRRGYGPSTRCTAGGTRWG